MYLFYNSKMSWFCPSPWKNVHLHPTGVVKPCCVYKGDYGQFSGNSIVEFYNGKMAIELRKSFINNQAPPSGCSKCVEKESIGVRSYRQMLLSEYAESFKLDLISEASLIESIDLSFSNKCNMKCRFCGPYCSSKWISDMKYLSEKEGGYWYSFKDTKWKIFQITSENAINIVNDLPGLKTIDIKGGEPFLSKEHLLFLEELVRSGRSASLDISYTTNGTILPEGIIDLLDKFQGVKLSISMEGVGDIYKYLRGDIASEQKVVNAIQYFEQLDNIEINIHFLLSAYNIFAPLMFDEWFNKMKLANKVSISIGTVVEPEPINLLQLPLLFRERAIREISKIDNKFVNQVKKILCNPNEYDNLEGFIRYVGDLDKLHQTNFLNIYPQYQEIF